MKGLLIAIAILSLYEPGPKLDITLVGNAGVLLSDGATSLLVDLPYESGAFGYQTYEPADLNPPGNVTAVITHGHLDHFKPSLFLEREEWRILGPVSVTKDLPPGRVITGDSVQVGAFNVVALPTKHTVEHQSYRIYWRGRVLHFSGDAQVVDRLSDLPELDLLFITPWLGCMAEEAGLLGVATREIAYHLDPSGKDKICGDSEILPQGSSFSLEPANN